MAIVTRQARKADFETLLKPTIRAASYISVNEPLAIRVYNGSEFEFDDRTLRPTGIPSAEAFGDPRLQYDQIIVPTGIPSAESLGTTMLILSIAPVGISSAEAFGTTHVYNFSGVFCEGIPSGEAFGQPALRYDQYIAATGIPSGELFGRGVFKWLRAEMLPSAPGLRFGMKKLAEKGSFRIGMKSIFGLKPIAGTCIPCFALSPTALEVDSGETATIYVIDANLCDLDIIWELVLPWNITYELLLKNNEMISLIFYNSYWTAEDITIRATAGKCIRTAAITVGVAPD